MIDDNRAENALDFLNSNAERHGQLKGAIEYHAYKVKRTKAQAFLSAEGSVEARKATAEIDEDVAIAVKEYIEVTEECKQLEDENKARELLISVYQTQSANTRRGNI